MHAWFHTPHAGIGQDGSTSRPQWYHLAANSLPGLSAFPLQNASLDHLHIFFLCQKISSLYICYRRQWTCCGLGWGCFSALCYTVCAPLLWLRVNAWFLVMITEVVRKEEASVVSDYLYFPVFSPFSLTIFIFTWNYQMKKKQKHQ